MCWLCGGEGTIVTCCDDMCRGLGECIHGDGEAECPECHDGRDCDDCDDDCEYRDVDRDDLGMDPFGTGTIRYIDIPIWVNKGTARRFNRWKRKRNKRRSAMRRQGKGGGR